MTTPSPRTYADRVPPYSEEAEIGVLGSIIFDGNKVMPLCLEKRLNAGEFFYVPAHRIVFEAMLELTRRGRPVDVVTVTGLLKDTNQLDRVGGAIFLERLIDQSYTSANVESYIETVLKKAKRRELITRARDIEADAFSEEEDLTDVLTKAQNSMFAAGEIQEGPSTNVDVLNDVIDRSVLAAQGTSPGLPFFLPGLNRILGCFLYGKPYFIGATPGAGKSTILGNMFKYWAKDLKIPCWINSIEMDHGEFLSRIVAEDCDISTFAMMTGMGGKESAMKRVAKFSEGCQTFVDPETGEMKVPLWIDDRQMDIDELRATARIMVRKYGIKAIGVDYLQILKAPSHVRGTRREQIIYVCDGLRQMAKELRVVLCVLSQLTKDGREERKPRASDMKEATEIHDMAYGVLMLYDWEGKTICEIQKNKCGLVGEREVEFVKARQRFVEVPLPDESEAKDVRPTY